MIMIMVMLESFALLTTFLSWRAEINEIGNYGLWSQGLWSATDYGLELHHTMFMT